MGTKITALGAIPEVANVDVLPIVDLTDTTTKKATITQIEARFTADGFLSALDNISELTNDSGFITASDFSNDGENAGVDRDLGNLDAFALSFITSGVGRINIEAGGNVGIGTSTPSEVLEVVGNAKIAGANDTEIGGVTVSGRMKIAGGLSYMMIQNANLSGIANHAMTQDGNGSTTLNGSNGRVLSLRVNQIAHIDLTANLIQNKKSTEFLNYVRVTGDGAAMALGQTTDINTAFLVKSNRTTILNIGSVSTTFLSMNSSGNVGIGTATPTEKLEVAGNAFVNSGKLTVSNAFNTSTGAIEATAQATSGSIGFTSAGKFNSLITTAGFSANNVGVLATAVGGTSETFAAKFQVNSGAVDTPTYGTYGVFSRNNATTTTANYAGYFKSENVNGSSNHAIYGFASGTGTKNIAGLFNATGATNNYAIIVPSGGGNVGIGTAAPTDTLQVVGNLNATRYKVNGVAGANFSGAVTSITVVDGLITAIS